MLFSYSLAILETLRIKHELFYCILSVLHIKNLRATLSPHNSISSPSPATLGYQLTLPSQHADSTLLLSPPLRMVQITVSRGLDTVTTSFQIYCHTYPQPPPQSLEGHQREVIK